MIYPFPKFFQPFTVQPLMFVNEYKFHPIFTGKW